MRRIIHVYNCIIMEMKKTIEKIPTWAFGYIFNGDMTGLTDEEVKQIDEAFEQIGTYSGAYPFTFRQLIRV